MTNRGRAKKYVDGHALTAAGLVLGTALVPGGASAVLLAQEAVMAHQIAKIYGKKITKNEADAIAAKIGLASVAGKILALEAAILSGPAAFLIKPGIAMAIVKILGEQIINYFDENEKIGDEEDEDNYDDDEEEEDNEEEDEDDDDNEEDDEEEEDDDDEDDEDDDNEDDDNRRR